MVRNFLRKLVEPETRTLYHWRCPCGAHSRGGHPSEYDAERRAERHQLEAGVELDAHLAGEHHPIPEVYATEDVID